MASDFIPDAQFKADIPSQNVAAPQASNPSDFIPDEQFVPDSEKFETPVEQAKTFGEGVAQGIAGPLAPLAETKVFGAKPEDIRARAEANPWTHGIGEGVGLTGSAMTGVGEAALLGKAGEAAIQATKAAGYLNDAAKAGTYGYKVGSAAVQQAAEMAVLQSSDEISKMILKDPDTSAQSALANIGISAMLGGAGGAFLSGAVNPLWKATVGPKAEGLLEALKTHVNGGSNLILPEALEGATKTLGVDLDPELKAAISQDPKAQEYFSTLRRGENQTVLNSIDNAHKAMSQSITDSLGIPLDEIAHYSENDAGHTVQEAFAKELADKYEPQALAMEKRNLEANTIPVHDEARNDFRNKLLERGIEQVGTDSPYYELYQHYGQRVLAKDTIGGMDALKTEIGNRMKGAQSDFNNMIALKDIRSALADFQESQIGKSADRLVNGVKSSKQVLADRAAVNASYSKFAGTMGDLTSHLGIGDFRGAGTLKDKIVNKLSPEQLLSKFSPKGNADFIPFLQQHFPETFEAVRRNETQSFLKNAVKQSEGETTLDFKNLGKTIERASKKEPERLNMALSPEVQKKVAAANSISQAIPSPRNSGTPAGIMKTLAGMPTSALAAVGYLSGHGALSGGLVGAAAEKLGMAIPEAYRLGYLRFLAADQPVSSAGFKSMIDFMHNTYKGQNLISKATSAVLKSGAQVLAASQQPVQADREKLDKQITDLQKNPDTLMQKNVGGQLGDYMPGHQTALNKTTTQVTQYLQSIKPQPHTFGPLDKPVPPQPSEIARYNRGLDIAIQPAIVMQHIKEGTLMPSDIQDLHAMYPELYTHMSQQLTNQMLSHHGEEETIPYKTKIGISLFLGQPTDASMMPGSIQAAQPIPKPPPQQQGKPKGSPSKVNQKQAKSYMTPSQSAESDRSDRS